MSLATETDAREAIKLILDDNSDDSDYTNAAGQPSTIEVVEDSPRRTKMSVRSEAIYLWKPADSDMEKMGAAGNSFRQRPIVQAEAWSYTSAAEAFALVEDIISIVGDYSVDNQQNTSFVDIWPIAESDHRHEHQVLEGDHFMEFVQIRLRRLDSI